MQRQLIEDGDTVFLGPGTTVAFLAEAIKNPRLTVITNCMPVLPSYHKRRLRIFKSFSWGEYRQVTESFVGEITNTSLEKCDSARFSFQVTDLRELMS